MNKEQLALYIAKAIVLVLAVLAYLAKLTAKLTYRYKAQIWKFALIVIAVTIVASLQSSVYAPKAKAQYKPEAVKTGPTQEDIEAYIKTIFGKDAKTFIAISHVECNPKNRAYPACVYHTDREYSVGIAQINLFNKSHWIHAGKVPGETMDEKIEWLKNPYNNTLIAYKIFTDSGFNAWTGYTSGRYENEL